MSDPLPRISITVACRNEAKHIRSFLDSLMAQDLDGIDWEVIVADGTSDDGTREILEEYCETRSNVRVISNPGRIVSTGLNSAIRMARGEVILRMDAHTSYAPDYCRRCLETLLQTGAGNVGGPARTRTKGAIADAVAAAYHSRFSTGGGRFHDVNYEGWVDTVPYGCWKKETLLRIGLFDETLVRNQDDELNLRLERSGVRIWQNPRIVSWYSPRASISGLFRQYFQYGFWKVAVIHKHRIPASWRHLVPIGFVMTHLFLLASIVVSAAMGAREWLATASLLWLTLASAYLIATLVFSVAAARRSKWGTLPYLPLVFAIYHFSYGLGFLTGLLKTRPLATADSAFTEITR